jgi:GNAT superfamily N-acetyltransferase
VVEAIAPEGSFEDVTGALAAVGLGSVPAWLRPYSMLSNGEQFRAGLARVLAEAPATVVIDEFTSVVDRQIARIGAGAFARAWRRTGGQSVLLTCHYDVLDWLEPDWVLDTTPNPSGEARFSGRWLRSRPDGGWYERPRIGLEVRQVDASLWPLFAPHYYLTLPKLVAPTYYAGFVDGEPVAHVGFSTRMGLKEARASRLVVMPEWQGAGVGLRFLNAVCDLWRRGQNRYGLIMPTLFHTSHPGLCAALRRDRNWTQVSAVLHGANRARCVASLQRSAARGRFKDAKNTQAGYGGHFRAVQGFRYLGEGTSCGS